MMRTLTSAEMVFAMRMALHIEKGSSLERAAQGVIEDDQRLFAALCQRGHSFFVPSADERGSSAYTGARQGDLIANHLAATVYRELRAPTN